MKARMEDVLGFGTHPDIQNEFEKNYEKQFSIAQCYKQIFTSEKGKKVLKDLEEKTTASPTWNWELGYQEAVAAGFAREGQNSIYRYILDKIASADELKEKIDNEKQNQQ